MAKKRRAKGSGSVITRRDGQGKVRYEARVKKNGRTYSDYRNTELEAEEALVELRKMICATDIEAPKDLTVGEFLIEYSAYRSHELEPSTRENYSIRVKKICASLGMIPLRQVTVQQLRAFIVSLHDSLCVLNRKAMYWLLRGAFKDALGQGYITTNPMEMVNCPTGEYKSCAQTWSAEEVTTFLAAAENHRLYAAFYLLIAIGLRPGEMYALTWDDLQMDVLTICKTAYYLDNELVISPRTKNALGNRKIFLSPDVLEVLEVHKKAQEEEFDVSQVKIEGNLMFPTESGKVYSRGVFGEIFHLVVKKAGVKKIRLYDLRHTCATLMRKRKVPLEVAADRLGHDPVTLLKVYSHVDDDLRKEYALSMNQLTARPKLSETAETARYQGAVELLKTILANELNWNPADLGTDDSADRLSVAVSRLLAAVKILPTP